MPQTPQTFWLICFLACAVVLLFLWATFGLLTVVILAALADLGLRHYEAHRRRGPAVGDDGASDA